MGKNSSREEYNTYMREFMSRRYYERRAAAIEQLGGKCSNCPAAVELEIDHKDRSKKKFNIGQILAGGSEKRVQEELSKCQLLCKKCHEEKSILEKGKQIAKGTHGTVSSYRYCHCALCKEAATKANREYRKNKRTRSSIGSST